MHVTKHPLFVLMCLCGTSAPVVAQGSLGVAARAGTLGFGGEVIVGASDDVAFRAGAGFSTLDAETSFGDVDVALELPNTWFDVGLDWYLGTSFRVGTGLLFQAQNPEIRGLIERPVEIGGQTLTPSELGDLTGVVLTANQVPYLRMGFGRHLRPGLGLFLDVGVGILGSPTVQLDASGGSLPEGQLRTLLDREAADFEANLKTYLRFWPIMSVGFRYGIGG